MTASKEQLAALLERVEAASGPDREIDAAIMVALVPYFSRPREYTASIDAAVALVERVLPRHTWHVSNYFGFSTGASAEIMQAVDAQSRPRAYAEAPTPALALCAAMLKALIAGERIGSPSQEQTASEQNKNLPPEDVE